MPDDPLDLVALDLTSGVVGALQIVVAQHDIQVLDVVLAHAETERPVSSCSETERQFKKNRMVSE